MLLLVLLLHLAAVAVLIRAFAPGIVEQVSVRMLEAVTVTLPAPPPKPQPEPEPSPPEPEGAAAEAGRKAEPREAAVPAPKLVLSSPKPAPPVAATGSELGSGAREAGAGTGGGGQGGGIGSGARGLGQGGGGASKAVKIAGDINSARDYPAASRELRLGDQVVVALTVGTDGRVKNCRVHRPSRDPEADRITCRLAIERFRFRPATDAAGRPVESVYGWQQRWFDPRKRD